MIIYSRILLVFLINFLFDYLTTEPNKTNETDIIITSISISKRTRHCIYAIRFLIMVYHLYYQIFEPFAYLEIFYLVMIFLGYFLRHWSFIALGNLFTFDICIRENHRLITDGPYRWLIHPSYTGLILFEMFAMLYFNLHYSIPLIILVLSFIRLWNRIIKEEALLKEKFPEFREYAKKRWRLIPFIF